MPLVNMRKILAIADADGFAIGAFSVGNMEMIMGAVRAAEETNTPIILQIAEKRLNASPLSLMAPMMVAAAKNSTVDIAVHLDHGLTVECVKRSLDLGFSSVMFDASLLPFEKNIEKTLQVIEIAKAYNAGVEAELGVVGGNEGDNAEHKILCTDPQKAKEFCERTNVDALAIAIGNAHGNYPVLPSLRFDILEEIYKIVSTPLVLHGGTGISDEMFKRSIRFGVKKINVATASFDALAKYAKNYTAKTDVPDYFTLSAEQVKGVYENIIRHIKIFNLEGESDFI